MPVGIIRIGAHVPPDVVDNATVARWSGASPDWTDQRTGIRERRYAADGVATSDLATAAALDALGADREEWPHIDWIALATSTGDRPQPATAALTQDKLGLHGIPAFDVNAVCSGFLFALDIGRALVDRPGGESGALVVAADMYSRIMNRSDRKTVALFGDGAGAAVLGPVPEGYGIHAVKLVTDGDRSGLVGVAAGGTAKALDPQAWEAGEHLFAMDGRAVRDYVLATLPKLVAEVLQESSLELGDIDRVIFHQANTRLLEQCVRDLGIDPARVPMTAPRYGNTGAASIPITLHDAHLRSPLRRGERVLLAGVGGGMTAGAAVMTWY
ncbi:3-oxoacyl-ACP synthase III family protein [Streptomyces sp. NPDC060184]|uniref:3-oxoacyl-ACP synthase III family protein n=1 Tax=Streptomyces sp. NPDC060184 TaxID=3347064 RepID=UPI0036608856